MKKLMIASLATASMLFAVSAASAGYWVPNGFGGATYVPTCGINYLGFYVCG